MRIFVNATPFDLPAGSSALDAIVAFDADEAAAVSSGARVITDSRGLPLDPATIMHAGGILRVVSARSRSADAS